MQTSQIWGSTKPDIYYDQEHPDPEIEFSKKAACIGLITIQVIAFLGILIASQADDTWQW